MRLSKLIVPALALASVACSDSPTAYSAPTALSGASDAGPSLALAPTSPRILQGLGGPHNSAQGISTSGRIVGTTTRPWLWYTATTWDAGLPTALPSFRTPSGVEVTVNARAISPNGRHVVGTAWDYDAQRRYGLLWTDGGSPRVLEGENPQPEAVNDAGVVVGVDGPIASSALHAFRWENGATSRLWEGWAHAINADGSIVGTRYYPNAGAYLWKDGAVTRLVGLDDARDISDLGHVAGAAGGRPALWRDGVVTQLGSLGGTYGYAEGVNNGGQVVGRSARGNGEWHPFVWESASGMHALPAPPGVPLQYIEVYDLNDAGQAVGIGYVPGGDGIYHALSWTVSPNAAPVIKTVKLTFPTLNRPRAGQSLPLSFVWSDADRAGGPWSWRLEWGDGSTSTGTATTQTEVGAAHTYTTAGPRTARFTITDAGGASATRTIPVEVQP